MLHYINWDVMTARRGVITLRFSARGFIRVRHFPGSRRGSSTRTAQKAVGPLRQLGRGGGCPRGRSGRGVAGLCPGGGEKGRGVGGGVRGGEQPPGGREAARRGRARAPTSRRRD